MMWIYGLVQIFTLLFVWAWFFIQRSKYVDETVFSCNVSTMQNSFNKSRFSCVNVSPGSKILPGQNLTGNLRLIRDIAADIHSCIQQWNEIHLNGISFLKIITSLKVDKSYPKELNEVCEELGKICDEADKIVNNLKLLSTNMKAIIGLHKIDNNLFTTWPIEKFASTTEKIYLVYQKEAIVKRIILENVAHDHRNSWKMLHLAAWVYQTQIPENIIINFESMLIETKLR